MRQTDSVSNDLTAGLYETVMTEALETQLAKIDTALVRRVGLREAEAPDRIAQLLARQVIRTLEAVPQSDRVAVGIEVAQLLTDALAARVPKANVGDNRPTMPGEMLD